MRVCKAAQSCQREEEKFGVYLGNAFSETTICSLQSGVRTRGPWKSGTRIAFYKDSPPRPPRQRAVRRPIRKARQKGHQRHQPMPFCNLMHPEDRVLRWRKVNSHKNERGDRLREFIQVVERTGTAGIGERKFVQTASGQFL